MSILSRPYAYSKMDSEDPDEIRHRRAQFLIYKVLEQADNRRRRPSFLRVRICKLKIKIGKRLKRMRKSMLLTLSAAKAGVCKQVMTQYLKTKKHLFGCGGVMASLPPVFS